MATKFALVRGEDAPNERIERCSEMLPNRMQCTRAGEFHVLDEKSNKTRQVCRAHAIYIRGVEQQIAEGQVVTDTSSPNKAILDRLNSESEKEKALNTPALSLEEASKNLVQHLTPEKNEKSKEEKKSEVVANVKQPTGANAAK